MAGLSIAEGIKQVYNGLRHVVILGAGASIASTYRNSELNGKKLPSMDNFAEVVGLQDLVEQVPTNLKAANFEKLYSNLHKNNPHSKLIQEIELRITEYFGNMQLPPEPTIYDYIILSLRSKDQIATFNWDPFLYQAFCRARKFTKDLPQISFLHGSVAIGYCEELNLSGPAGYYARADGGYFEPTKLLYPIEKKNYSNDKFIKGEWDRLKIWLDKDSKTTRFTIFGYGAPASDIEAVTLLNKAWGTSEERDMEQVEIIDICEEKVLRQRWDGFIHSHHYDVTDDYFSSSLASNPRRTCESLANHTMPMNIDEAFRKNNPVPKNLKTLEELWAWHEPLIRAEQEKN